jgi:hypothetical protein
VDCGDVTEIESSRLQRNITQEPTEVTLYGSKLIEIDVNTTPEKEITHKFCRESKEIFLRNAEYNKV